MSERIVAIAENGVAVTQSMIDEWCAAYEAGETPSGYTETDPVVYGRPALFDGGMESFTVRIPAAQKRALQTEARERGISLSTYVRQVLAMRTV